MADGIEQREVITVLGPISPEEMGTTQTHEHLLIDAMDHYGGYGTMLVANPARAFSRPASTPSPDVS